MRLLRAQLMVALYDALDRLTCEAEPCVKDKGINECQRRFGHLGAHSHFEDYGGGSYFWVRWA